MSSLQYATLQEAWGDALPPRRRKKTRDAAVPVGVSDDKEYRESRIPGEIEYRAPAAADDYLAWSDYSKEPGQRTDAPLTGLDGPARRFPAEAAVIPDVKVDPADTGAQPAPEPRPYIPPTVLDSVAFAPQPPADSGNAGYDVAMYVFTGIMLILLLEQFVQMGAALRPNVGAFSL